MGTLVMGRGVWRTGYRTSNGFKQFFRDWQPGEGHYPPVLALHGSLTQSGMWVAVAEKAASLRMLCPDQRGFGLSEDPGTDSCAEFAADALALADDLCVNQYVIAGHSFACSIALEIARLTPQRIKAVVLVDPVVQIGPKSAAPTALSTAPAKAFTSLDEAAEHFRKTEEGSWPNDALKRFVADIMMRDDDIGTWRFPYSADRLARLRPFIGSPASDYSLFAKARHVNVPVLIFRGGVSKRFPIYAEGPFVDAFATKPKVVVCPKSGHFPTVTECDFVIDVLKGFLKQ